MLSIDNYKQLLSSRGTNEGIIRKNQSDFIMDKTFTLDPSYKKVYILTNNGWKYEDAKYRVNTKQSIVKDSVDYYLQFRPSVHFPIGSYVIVPDDTSPNINLNDNELTNPFLQPVNKRSQWWLIVGRDNSGTFVRYNILQCNWNFQWVWNGKVQSCFGCVRNANSYTSGKWSDSMSSSLDDLNGAWLPDNYTIYGDRISDLDLSDTRTIMHEQRFMLTNNTLDPKVYQVTKILELFPQGIIKMSLKQDELNLVRDNIELRICDYYAENGDSKVDQKLSASDDEIIATIRQCVVDNDNELSIANTLSTTIIKGISSYYNISCDNHDIDFEWNVELVDVDGNLSDVDKSYYCGLIKVTKYNKNTVVIKPGKAKSLSGKHFNLIATDKFGNYYSSIELEVSE